MHEALEAEWGGRVAGVLHGGSVNLGNATRLLEDPAWTACSWVVPLGASRATSPCPTSADGTPRRSQDRFPSRVTPASRPPPGPGGAGRRPNLRRCGVIRSKRNHSTSASTRGARTLRRMPPAR
ncbi:hypothetical protein GCM10010381_41300 [Streptomyces xantholiticus]|nr:hypothetical protein GCM10010381_41300 [Streptomyces xantholiticus]